MKLLHAYYDFRVAPLSFDFAFYLAIACVEAWKTGSLLAVTLFHPSFRQNSIIEQGFTEGYQAWKYSNVPLRLCHLCPTVVEVVSNRSPRILLQDPRFPANYDPNQVDLTSRLTSLPCTHFELNAAMGQTDRRVVYQHTARAENWFKARFAGREVVSLVVRQTPHNHERNASLRDWYEVYQQLTKRGFDCIIIPDQDDVLGARSYLEFDWEAVEEASLDLDIRLAMHQNSFANVVWTGGATTVLPLSGARFIQFGLWLEANPLASRSFFARKGPAFREQPLWFNPKTQRYDWHPAQDCSPEYIARTALDWLLTLPQIAQ